LLYYEVKYVNTVDIASHRQKHSSHFAVYHMYCMSTCGRIRHSQFRTESNEVQSSPICCRLRMMWTCIQVFCLICQLLVN